MSETLQFDVFDDRAAGQAQSEPVYRMTSGTTERWACVNGPAAGGARGEQFATGQVIYDGLQAGSTTGANLIALWFNVPADAVETYEDWYRTEHGPLLLKEPRWLRSRQVRITSSNVDATHLVLHDLADMTALSSDALVAAQKTPLREYHAQQDWFGNNVTQVYTRL
jgi:hypothetical protein